MNDINRLYMQLFISNTMTNKVELFEPLDADNIRMYVCGPTVYDRPHLGNIRSAIVFDILYRVLCHIYPRVQYVRNITDIDDKIIVAARERGIGISELTSKAIRYYRDDLEKVNCVSPTVEPKASAYIEKMICFIEELVNKGYAYVSAGNVMFEVSKYARYGELSGRVIDDMCAGKRISVPEYKRHATDFVLWKETKVGEEGCVFHSPWGLGRPGWHIECSTMSNDLLGSEFDIHGGGEDLTFPHHENEIAQSCCMYEDSRFARYWVHNGFLTVDGHKMSKSFCNFKNIDEMIKGDISGAVIRYFFFTTQYHKPLDLNERILHNSMLAVQKFTKVMVDFDLYRLLSLISEHSVFHEVFDNCCVSRVFQDILAHNIGESKDFCYVEKYLAKTIKILCNNLNTPAILAYLHKLSDIANNNCISNSRRLEAAVELIVSCGFLGIRLDASKVEKNGQSQYQFEQKQSIRINYDEPGQVRQPKADAYMSPTLLDDMVEVAVREESNIKTVIDITYFGDKGEHEMPVRVMDIVRARCYARQAKNWELADNLRQQISELGYDLVDSKECCVVRKKKNA